VIVGLTGRVGSGKSKAANWLQAQYKCEVLDLDQIGHRIIQEPTFISRLVDTFGCHLLDEAGQVNRQMLSQLVFSDSNALKKLNAIVHPEINFRVKKSISQSPGKFWILEGALIQEIGLDAICDAIVVISASEANIVSHIGDKFLLISPFQRSDFAYRNSSKYVIKNNFDTEFFEQLSEVADRFGLTRRSTQR